MINLLPVCRKETTPYVVELVCGPHDGLAKPMTEVPFANSLAVSDQGLIQETSEGNCKASVYGWKNTQIRLVDGLPVIVFRYQFVKCKFPEQCVWRRFWQPIASRFKRK